MHDDSDEDLMRRYQRGDVRAFEALVQRYDRPLYGFVQRYVRSRALAEDIVQDTFLRVVRSADALLDGSKFSTWLYMIARNRCVDVYRSGGTQPTLVGQAVELDSVPSSVPGVAQHVIGAEMKQRMREALDALLPEQREVFVLREVNDLPFHEIAQIVGASEGAVKSRLRLALEKLREALADYRDLAEATL